jgi:predicted AlkP superfamily pyrophosphatase or phosphodiesterase
MKATFVFYWLALLLLQSGHGYSQQLRPVDERYVVVVSMDGFRYDYDDRTSTPVLDSIAAIGVKVEHFVPAFPSLTFPNHYTMACGLYPDHHGIVHNHFYDERLDMEYRIGSRKMVENADFYKGEPVWVSAEKQGVKTACFYWVGSESPIMGKQPTYWHRYDQSVPYRNRVDTVIHWLNLPKEQRPGLIMWYVDEPDGIGHEAGPEGLEVEAKVRELDELLGYFFEQLQTVPYRDQIDLIFLSDHGMQELDPVNKVEFIDEYIKTEWIKRITGYNPVINLEVQENCIDSVYWSLKRGVHFKVYKEGEFPAEWNYGSHSRTLDLTIVADSGWIVRTRDTHYEGKGAHGYDINNVNMHGIFYACGPSFKKAYRQERLENVNLYGIILRILKLKPEPNDGKPAEWSGMLSPGT